MSTLILLAVLSQSNLGEVGETCRTNADCSPALSCINAACAIAATPVMPRPPPPTTIQPPNAVLPKPPPPTFQRPSAPLPKPPTPTEIAGTPVEAETVEAPEPSPAGPFDGNHFYLGMSVGLGPLFGREVGATKYLPELYFVAPHLTTHLRVGALFRWFEIGLEVSPVTSVVLGTVAHASGYAAFSIGALPRLFANDSIAVYWPFRLQANVHLAVASDVTALGIGGGVQLVGIGVRLGTHLLLEAILLAPQLRISVGGAAKSSLPSSLSATILF
jgi:hypothetical protein